MIEIGDHVRDRAKPDTGLDVAPALSQQRRISLTALVIVDRSTRTMPLGSVLKAVRLVCFDLRSRFAGMS
jgi:hypothetical protein